MALQRVRLTPSAEDLVRQLQQQHGPVMFHQSGGCCDGSSPMCYPRGEFRVGGSHVLLGCVAGDVPYWMSADQYAYWQHTHLTVDVEAGRGGGFSLEAPEGVRFLLRSRLLTDAELDQMRAEPPLPSGADTARPGRELRKALDGVPDHMPVRVVAADEPGGELAGGVRNPV